jgi:glycerol-3-phosphate dehydrogenase
MLSEIPFLNEQGLKGGFQYYDASMWDDVLVIENLRSAVTAGAAVANYVEAVSPLWNGDLISGFKVKDLEASGADREIQLRAKRVVVCAGPWTDEIGSRISENWRPWLNPSKGVHLVFDLKRIPIAGAMVMSHPEDGRISFVIPRPDLGGGVVIVGTTDSPSPKDPAKSTIDPQDVQYLMTMLQKYFPKLELKTSDILSAYVGVRPLMGQVEAEGGAGAAAASLQKVSREHYIGPGPGGTVVVAGGKYTTHRKMAEEIIDFTLDHWKMDSEKGRGPEFVQPGPKSGELPVNPQTVADVTAKTRREAQAQGLNVPEQLWDRYGAEALKIFEMSKSPSEYPDGFPALDAQLRHAIRNEMVLHLDDFYLRRAPLYLARADHGRPWAAALAKVWAEERGGSEGEVAAELARLEREVAKYSDWMKSVT